MPTYSWKRLVFFLLPGALRIFDSITNFLIEIQKKSFCNKYTSCGNLSLKKRKNYYTFIDSNLFPTVNELGAISDLFLQENTITDGWNSVNHTVQGMYMFVYYLLVINMKKKYSGFKGIFKSYWIAKQHELIHSNITVAPFIKTAYFYYAGLK